MAGHATTPQEGLRVDHHFENADQQYQSAKLGMWVFLATEILFFGGLFVAYSVYRANHPEVFVFGHHFLDKNLGALNTVILICSSLTAAWAVRAAQLKQIRILKLMLVLTLLCAFGFLGVKGVEYHTKWKHGLLWAGSYHPHLDHDEPTTEIISDQDLLVGGTEVEAEVVSAFEMDQAQLADLVTRLEKHTGKKVKAHVMVDKELIGGVKVVLGDKVIDGSARAQLGALEAALKA